MMLAELAAVSTAVAGTRSRNAKVALLADCLRRADRAELPIVVAWLAGSPRQRRTGLGWAALREPPPAAGRASLTVAAVDAGLDRAAAASGTGAAGIRRSELAALLAAATPPEQALIGGLLAGELRQGAAAGVVLDAVAAAAAVPVELVRRAVTLSGDLPAVAVSAVTGGEAALAGYGLRVGRPLSAMLAQSAADLAEALGRTGPAGVEWKLDGVRVQVHRDGDEVAVFTRTLDDVTARVPEVVRAARSLDVRTAVLDGEVLALRPDQRPAPFQVTSSMVARRATGKAQVAQPDRQPDRQPDLRLVTVLFDALHLDGDDLVDQPGETRRAALVRAAPADLVVPRFAVADPADPVQLAGAQVFATDALARGHEGVVVKAAGAGYAMGRRGSGWIKVKPRLTLDLVVLAAEWGHGRRTGWLSNLHLGARDPDGAYGPPGGFVMLGKTFKGLTDQMLRWQTEQLQRLATSTDRWHVLVRPDLVVEIAFDGVQSSPRYPAGLALRFARVLAHRPDKPAAEANTVADVRAHHPG